MKVHPSPSNRTITLRYNLQSPPTATTATTTTATAATAGRPKKLRRLPHIFAKVLELPFFSDADISVEETPNSFKFVVDTADDIGSDVAAHAIEIVPGVTKLVVGGVRLVDGFPVQVNEIEVKLWRFRLPASTLPELATAAFSDGELVVTVPKGVDVHRNQIED